MVRINLPMLIQFDSVSEMLSAYAFWGKYAPNISYTNISYWSNGRYLTITDKDALEIDKTLLRFREQFPNHYDVLRIAKLKPYNAKDEKQLQMLERKGYTIAKALVQFSKFVHLPITK